VIYSFISGHYNPNLRLPHVPVSDGVGEVAAVGEEVTRVKPGDRVAGAFAQNWLSGKLAAAPISLGAETDGMLAEYVVLHEDGVVQVPEHLSDEQAATLPCAAVTAWNALIEQGRLKSGDTVLILGTGEVALFALQFAVMAGAKVIVTSGSDEKLARARDLGAAAGINYKKYPNWGDQVLGLTRSAGVNHVVEVGGGDTLAQSLQAVAIGGRISVIGILSGIEARLPLLPVLMKMARLQGVYVGSRATFEAMCRAIALHQLEPIIDRVFPFKEAPDALRYKQAGGGFGKVVIRF